MIAPGPAGQLFHPSAARRTMKDDDGGITSVPLGLPNGGCDVQAVLALDVGLLNRRVGLADHMDIFLVRQRCGAARVPMDFSCRGSDQEKTQGDSLHSSHRFRTI